MEANLEVNPADIRFTQDSINLYFQVPYDEFSVREAVRKLARNEMQPDDFPPIRVNSYKGCLWSIDNRRLWVFRLARCSSINVKLVKKFHQRVKDVLSDGHLRSMMQGEDFFPRLRDRGRKDLKFDRLFPLPVSSSPVDEAFEKPPVNVAQVSEVDTEIFGTSTMPAEPSMNPVEEHKYGQSGRGKEDLKFDQQFPQPESSLQLPVDEALEKPPINVAEVSKVDTEILLDEALEKPTINVAHVSEVDTEIFGTSTMPAEPSMNPVEEHDYGQSDRGKEDLKLDQQFPQRVSSLQLPVDEALEKPRINVAQVSNVDAEISGTTTMSAKSSINPVEEQIEINIVEERGTTGPTKPSIHPMEDLKRTIANLGILITNAVGSSYFKIIFAARKSAAAVGSFVSNVFAKARKIVSAVHKCN